MANIKAYTKTTVTEQSGEWAGDGFKYEHIMPHGIVLEVADFATDYTDTDGKIVIPSGTLVGRTYAERDAGTGYGVADVATDDQIFLTTVSIYDAVQDENHETGVYRHQRLVYEDQLPRYNAATNAFTTVEIDKIRELYQCMLSPDPN